MPASGVTAAAGARLPPGDALLPAGLALCCTGVALSALQTLAGASPGTLIAATFIAVVGLVLVHRPLWALPVFLAFTWSAVDTLGVRVGSVSVLQAGLLVFLGLAASRVLRGEHHASWRPALAVVLLLAAGLLGPALLSGTVSRAVAGIEDLAFLLVAAVAVRGLAGVDRAITGLVTVGIVLGLGATSSVLLGPTPLFAVVTEEGLGGASSVSRAAGPFGEPNFFALSLAALVPFALLLAARRGAARPVGAVALAAITAGVLATGSRGGLLALAAATVIWGLSAGAGRQRLAALLAVGVVAALLPLFATQASGSRERAVEGRATEAAVAVAVFRDHPFAGIGPGSYPVYYRDYTRTIGNDARTGREAHSLPLQIAAEQGVAGLAAWATALALLAGYARRARLWRTPLGRAVCLAPVTYLVGSLFLHGSQLRLLYVLGGLVLAACAATEGDARRVRVA